MGRRARQTAKSTTRLRARWKLVVNTAGTAAHVSRVPLLWQVCEDDTETRRNQILVCASCTRGYHQLCLSPPLSRVPEEDWYCPRCPDPKKDDDASSAHSDDTDDVDANEGGGRDDVEDFADLCTSEAGVSAADIAAAGPPFDLPVYRYDPHH